MEPREDGEVETQTPCTSGFARRVFAIAMGVAGVQHHTLGYKTA